MVVPRPFSALPLPLTLPPPLLLSLLLSSGVLLVGASYYQRQDVLFDTEPSVELSAAAPLDCAFRCDGREDCVGFVHTADGTCQMFDSLPRVATDPSAVVPGSYVGDPVHPCPAGWFVFRDRCYFRYLRAEGRLNFTEHRAVCQSFGDQSDLAVPTDVQETSWLTYHSSRTKEAEYTGLKLQDGSFFDLDGSHVSIELQLPKVRPDPGYVNLKVNKAEEFYTRPESVVLLASVCEAPSQPCGRGARCPPDWLALDDYCYFYISSKKTWKGADTHCAELQPGARLSPVIDMETYRVLRYSFSFSGVPWTGISDRETEGTWKSVDDSAWSVAWMPGQPDGGTEENCAAITPTGLNTRPCSTQKEFLCRLPAAICVK